MHASNNANAPKNAESLARAICSPALAVTKLSRVWIKPIGKRESTALIWLCRLLTAAVVSLARLRFQHDLPGICHLLESEIETGTNVFADPAAMIFRVLRDPNDGNRPLHLNCVVDHELTADRVAAAIEMLHHGFIHDSNTSRCWCVLLFNSSPRENRNANHFEVTGTDVVFERDPIALGAAKPGHDDRVGGFTAGKKPVGGIGHGTAYPAWWRFG